MDSKSGGGSLRRREIRCFLGDYHRARGDLAEARAWYLQAAEGAPPSSPDPSFQAWIDAWTGELLWIDREEARVAGRPFPPESAARFDELIRGVEARDPGNRRAQRWKTAFGDSR